MDVVREDDAAPTAHWRHAGRRELLPVLQESVLAFAADRGMSARRRQQLSLALTELLEAGSGGPQPTPWPVQVRIDAATDGDWFTLRVACDGVAHPPGRRPIETVRRVADRIELAPGGENGILMEFCMS
jgi:hypothetical protein